MTNARSIGEPPRGPTDLYNARFSSKRNRPSNIADQQGVRKIWSLLVNAKREDENCADSVFIRECRVYADYLVVLATNSQPEDITTFCTNPNDFCIFGVDPTFNIFDENISLTVTTYRNLKLRHKSTNKPPVFIGPFLMHQRTECLELEEMSACGTEGKKALIDGLKRNFRLAIFLRCFGHFKDNVQRELKG